MLTFVINFVFSVYEHPECFIQFGYWYRKYRFKSKQFKAQKQRKNCIFILTMINPFSSETRKIKIDENKGKLNTDEN